MPFQQHNRFTKASFCCKSPWAIFLSYSWAPREQEKPLGVREARNSWVWTGAFEEKEPVSFLQGQGEMVSIWGWRQSWWPNLSRTVKLDTPESWGAFSFRRTSGSLWKQTQILSTAKRHHVRPPGFQGIKIEWHRNFQSKTTNDTRK